MLSFRTALDVPSIGGLPYSTTIRYTNRYQAILVTVHSAMPHRPGDVAKQLNIAAVTLRVWSNEFASFLSDSAQRTVNAGGKPSHRIYSDSDIHILKHAAELLSAGQTFDQVRHALGSSDPPPISIETLEEIPNMLARLQSAYRQELAARDQTLAAKDETITEQRSHIGSLREEIERRQGEIDRQQAEIERLKNRTFWDRLRNK